MKDIPAPTHTFLGSAVLLSSTVTRCLLERVMRLAQAEAAVLITGETGSGKEWVARALHHYSPRRDGPWVDVSCATLPEQLAESELFGHERGAFSGAHAAKPGLFEMAGKGTLFLDEIGELDHRLQAKLLRVLDGTAYYRLGGTRKMEVTTRLIAATHRRLEQQIAEGHFREDLFHRLNQLTLEVPPLRHRRSEVIPLARYFLHGARPGCEWSPEAEAALESYSWPGNVRELRNTVLKVAWEANEHVIGPGELPVHFGSAGDSSRSLTALAESIGAIASPLPASLEIAGNERRLIAEALQRTRGRRAEAAKLLGISRRTLSRKLGADGRE